jgi:thiamine transporter
MIALSVVLGFIKVADMPYGGSVTLASMLPIVIVAFRHGIGWGMGAATTNSLVQLITGIKYFSYFTTWQSIVALILFDYIFAFAVFGLAGIFKGKMKQNLAIATGALLASLVRYICHVISGATIWAGLSIPTGAALAYSLGYNATYMIPETVILVAVCAYLASIVDFRRTLPVRMQREAVDGVAMTLYSFSGLVLLGAVIADCALVFPHLQNAESGAFDITGLSSAPWLAVLIASAASVIVAIGLVLVAKKRKTA